MSKYIVREGMKSYSGQVPHKPYNGLVVTKAPLFYGSQENGADKGEGLMAKAQKWITDNKMLLIILGLGGLAAFLFRDKLGFGKKKRNPVRRRRRNRGRYAKKGQRRKGAARGARLAYDALPKRKKRKPTKKKRKTTRKRKTNRKSKMSAAQKRARSLFVNRYAKGKKRKNTGRKTTRRRRTTRRSRR